MYITSKDFRHKNIFKMIHLMEMLQQPAVHIMPKSNKYSQSTSPLFLEPKSHQKQHTGEALPGGKTCYVILCR